MPSKIKDSNFIPQTLYEAEKLRKLGFITTFPSTGETHVCASRAEEIIKEGLIVVNEYRVDVGLSPLDRKQI